MVNIIDCIRTVATDKYAFIKIAILAIPAIISTHALMSGQMVLSITLNIVFGIIFAAVFFETIRRSCNSEPMLLPTFLMPVRMFITLGFTILAAIPIVIVNILLFLLFVHIFSVITILSTQSHTKSSCPLNLVCFQPVNSTLDFSW